MNETLPLRPNVCMILVNQEKKIFLGERFGEKGIWQLPQGGAEAGLSLEENVLKELNEETGAEKDCFKIITKLKATHEYNFDKPPDYAKGKWRGQSQTFWLVEFTGNNSDFDLNRFTPEFMDYRWCTAEEILKFSEPKRIKGYEKVLKEVIEYFNS